MIPHTLPASHMPSGEPPYMPDKWNKGRKDILRTHNCYTYMLNDLYVVPRKHGKPQPGYFARANSSRAHIIDKFKRLSCRQVQKGVNHDNPHIRTFSLKDGRKFRCPKEHYKGIMIVSPGNDYHFARQDNRMIKVYRKMHSDRVHIPNNLESIIALFLKYSKHTIPEIWRIAKGHVGADSTDKQLMRKVIRLSRTWSHKPGATEVTDRDASGDLILNPESANWDYSPMGGINYNVKCCYFSIPNNNIAYTKSTGVSFGHGTNDNPLDVRIDISTLNHIDAQYEAVIRKALN